VIVIPVIAIPMTGQISLAHNVKTAADVAATFHLEPDHNPRAGEPSQVWFALTKAGGKVIPLQDCDCQLAVMQAGQTIGAVPLQPIDAEQYQGIPGGNYVFPQVGIYQLVLRGKAKGAGQFQPFELKYDVTVQPGKETPTGVATQTQNSFIPENSIDYYFLPVHGLASWQVGLGLGVITLGLGTLIWRLRRRKKGPD
jgi:hypothetical protein